MIEGRETGLRHCLRPGHLSTESVNNSETVWITRTVSHSQPRLAWGRPTTDPHGPSPATNVFEVISR